MWWAWYKKLWEDRLDRLEAYLKTLRKKGNDHDRND